MKAVHTVTPGGRHTYLEIAARPVASFVFAIIRTARKAHGHHFLWQTVNG